MGVDCRENGLNIQIMLINNIVEEAVKHGADDGGSYENNPFKLEAALEDWIKINNLEDFCYVGYFDDSDAWCKLKIARKKVETDES